MGSFLLLMTQSVYAQDNRRAQYYETFLEVKEPIDSMVVLKSKRELLTFHAGRKVKRYIISLGMEPEGRKRVEGDMRTPEGLYHINHRDTNSAYHKNLGISYPNTQDSLYAASLGNAAVFGRCEKTRGDGRNHRRARPLAKRAWRA